jgi:hypothetical protein
MLHVVTYEGPLGFIKPAQAVRDEQIYSQRFLAPATVEGMRRKLGASSIDRVRLDAKELTRPQQETIQAPTTRIQSSYEREESIVERRLLLRPTLYLGFEDPADADLAERQHLCLCRNEDVVLPTGREEMTREEFDQIPGFTFVQDPDGTALAGRNRYTGDLDRGRVEYIRDSA